MSNEFLGVGWGFPLSPRSVSAGDQLHLGVEMAYYEESIHQSIWIILSTARGERKMRPDFGCGIHNLIFAFNNASTAGLIRHEVEQALLFWEPRIDVLEVRIEPQPNETLLLIAIEYHIRATNSRSNVVYPFYLERSQA